MNDVLAFSEQDRRYMQRALELAARGLESVSPNPCVGAVIVQNNQVIGEGWHQKAGEAHAEIIALQEAFSKNGSDSAVSGRLEGATVYVTLEPCSHTGRTGPCVDALIAANVAKVIFAMADPNPHVAGSGASKLEAAGIAVSSGLLQEEAMQLNRGYLRRMVAAVPRVTLKLAASLDGRSAMASGESQWITGEAARRDGQRLRAESCAILTGSRTVLRDDPQYSVREQQLGRSVFRQPALWICDSTLRIPSDAKVLQSARSLQREVVLLADNVAVSGATSVDKKKRTAYEKLGVRVELLESSTTQMSGGSVETKPNRSRSGSHQIIHPESDHAIDHATEGSRGLDLSKVLTLMAQSEVNNLLVEAGPTLSGSMLASGLVDELVYYIAPRFLGSTAMPMLDMAIETLADSIDLDNATVDQLGQDFRITATPRNRAQAVSSA